MSENIYIISTLEFFFCKKTNTKLKDDEFTSLEKLFLGPGWIYGYIYYQVQLDSQIIRFVIFSSIVYKL